MSKNFEELDNVFNVSSEIVEKKIENDKKMKVIDDTKEELFDEFKKDYEYARGNIYSIIEKGQEALNGILELAQETESPRAYEVVGQLIKNVSDSTEKLIDLQKKLKDIENYDNNANKSGTTNVTNALFVGSTAELSKLLKSQRNQEKDK